MESRDFMEKMENTFDIENKIAENSEAKKNIRKTGNHTFVTGFAVGVILTFVIIFSTMFGLKLYRNYRISRAIDSAAGSSTVSEDEELVNEKLIKKLGVLETIIDRNFFGEYTREELEDGIYKGLVGALNDKYADYYSVEEMQEQSEDTAGKYGGIGAYISFDEEKNCCVIAGTIPNTPAEEADLRDGDLIVMVDEVDTIGMTSTEIVKLIKGEEGTSVHLTLIRDGEDDYIEVDLERAIVDSPSVTYEMMEDEIGYIGISEFNGTTADHFTEAMAALKAENAKGIIIDVRSNLGGNLDAVCAICREILPEGLIVYTQDKYGNKQEFECDGSNELTLPLVVLTNGYSASASEILTGAVKDYGIGTVMGTKTYGKGIVQTIIPLTDGSAIKLTTSKYFTPKGTCIHGVGIEPDIEVEFDSERYYEDGYDNQLEAALEELKNQL